MMLVTLEQAKAHLRVDTNAEDDDITLRVQAASAAVLNYLKVDDLSALAVGDPPLVPDNVTFSVNAAVLLMVGYLYRNRDENPNGEFLQGYLPAPITALLYPLRDPSLA